MFGLSTWELLIIVAVALIFVGPDQLPKVARTIGKGMRQVRGAMGKVDDEMRKAVREVSAELDDEGHPLQEAPYRRPSERTEASQVVVEPTRNPAGAEPDMAEPTGTVAGGKAATAPEKATDGTATAPEKATDETATAPEKATDGTPAKVDASVTPVEVQTSRRGAGRTMNERPSEALGTHARDWSEVGKAPIPGRIAQAPRSADNTPDTPQASPATEAPTPPPEGPEA